MSRKVQSYVLWSAVLIIGLSSAITLSYYFIGFPHKKLDEWATHVIFGLYFVILYESAEGLLFRHKRSLTAKQKLFLLASVALCSDLVGVNYQESKKIESSYYALIVVWDLVTFFIWKRAIKWIMEGSETESLMALPVAVAFVLKLGREILLMPYARFNINSCDLNKPGELISPYLDVMFGDLPLSAWFCLSWIALKRQSADGMHKRWQWFESVIVKVVFAGCVYWGFRAIEDLADLAGIPFVAGCSGLLPVIYCVAAICLTYLVWRYDLLQFGTLFGVRSRRMNVPRAHE